MDRKDVERHMDAKLALLIADRASAGHPKPMSTDEIAGFCGVSHADIAVVELGAFKKLRLNPDAWEAVTMSMRRSS